MTPLIRRLLGAAGCAAALAAAGQALAGGFESPLQSVRGLGSAGSDGAAAQGLDHLWSNPAAIADVDGRVLYLSASYVAPRAGARDDGSMITRPFMAPAPVGGTSPTHPVGAALTPSLAVAWGVSKQLSAGLSIAAPFGFDLQSTNGWTRYQGSRVNLINGDLQASLAWRANDRFSVGFGLDAVYGRVRLKSALPNLSPIAPDGESDFWGSGWNYGWVAGAQWRPTDRIALGASYRSGVDHDLEGRLITLDLFGPLSVGNGRKRATALFDTPDAATLAARWRIADRVTLTAQTRWSGWSRFDTIRVDYPAAPPQASTSTRDTTSAAVGVEFQATPRLALRAGIQDDPQAIAGSAMLTDGDRRLYAAGATFALNDTAFIDGAVGYLDFATARIDADATAYAGTPLAMPARLQGDLSARALAVSFALRRAF